MRSLPAARLAGLWLVSLVAMPLPAAGAPAADRPLPWEHPALATGWVRSFLDAEPLLVRADPEAQDRALGPSRRIAARVINVRRGADGRAWARVGYGGGVRGWVAAAALRAVPAPEPFPPRLRRALDRLSAPGGAATAVVVRDRWGRTLYRRNARRPLVLASVTKLFTVGAALDHPIPGRLPGRILAPSDNGRAQALIEWLGRGSNRAGTRIAERHAADRGAVVDLADGSGLDPRNRAAAWEVTDYLLAMREHRRFRAFKLGLAVAGRTGTLKDRLTDPASRGRVYAKTGTLFVPPTSALAGYLRPRVGRSSPNAELTFAILMNATPYRRARGAQDRIVRLLISRV